MALKGKSATAPVAEALAENAPTVTDQSSEATTPAWEQEAQQLETSNPVAVVEQPQAQALEAAKPKGTSVMSALNNGEDDGFGALDDQIGFGSFPMVKLDKNKFVVERAEFDTLDVRLMSARPKYAFKAKVDSNPKTKASDDDPMVYSYDGTSATSGISLDAIKKEWAAQGFMHAEKSTYMECAAEVISDNQYKGRIVLLNVAPASTKRLGGYRAEVRLKGHNLSDVVTTIFPGDKIEIDSKKNFYPWNFKLAANQE